MPKHLQSYLDAYVCRFNHRNDPQAMYATLADQIKDVRDGKYGEYHPIGK